jgi:3'-5' exoribonuclease
MAGGHRFVVELRDNDKLQGEVFHCVRKSVPVDRTGRRYLSLMLGDRSGQIEALLWEEAEQQGERFSAFDFVAVTGLAVPFQGRRQLHLTEISRVDPGTIASEDYQRRSPVALAELWRELEDRIASVGDPDLRRLLESYRADTALREKLVAAPAARSIHHAYPGGLLQHTLSVVGLCDQICSHYKEAQPGLLNRDLCIAGAFLHDLGKIWEISSSEGFQYTDRGRLIGHIVLGLQELELRLATLPEFPPALADHLRHIVISHHGQLEHGSPRRPKTAEALVVHRADELDAQMGALREIFDRTPGKGWTTYQPLYERYFFHGPPSGSPLPPPTVDSQAALAPTDPVEEADAG